MTDEREFPGMGRLGGPDGINLENDPFFDVPYHPTDPGIQPGSNSVVHVDHEGTMRVVAATGPDGIRRARDLRVDAAGKVVAGPVREAEPVLSAPPAAPRSPWWRRLWRWLAWWFHR